MVFRFCNFMVFRFCNFAGLRVGGSGRYEPEKYQVHYNPEKKGSCPEQHADIHVFFSLPFPLVCDKDNSQDQGKESENPVQG